MQFEKRGRGLLREAFRNEVQCVVCLKRGGKEKLFLSTGSTPMFTSVFQDQYFLFSPLALSKQHTPPHSGKLPAVTHVLLFQTASKMMSRQCVVAEAVSKKNCILLSNIQQIANLQFI